MILCCGEALIDMVPIEVADKQTAYTPLSGGAGLNTAIALGRLEIPVQFLSGISNDLFGTQLVSELRASNVGTDLLIRSDRPTTLAFVKLTSGQAQYIFYDENTAGRMITERDLPDVGPDISALLFGGISLCTEPAADAYETLALRKAETAVVMLDPNIRPNFVKDEAAYRARLDRMMAVADIVKVSDEDLDWIVPDMKEPEAKIGHFHGKGVELVIITKGGDGASAHVKGQPAVEVIAPKATVVDTVGAGDTFNAGFLAKLHCMGLLHKGAIAEIEVADIQRGLEYAAKVAAITVSRPGANPPYLSEL